MPDSMKGSIMSKKAGKTLYKLLSLKERTREEAQIIIDEWKDGIRKENEEITMNKNSIQDQPTAQPTPNESQEQKNYGVQNITLQDIINTGFRPNTGNSIVIIASSFSGKTYLIDSLFNLIEKRDKIIKIYMVGDTTGDYDKSHIIMDGIHPNMIYSLKSINDALDKRYNFWVVYDDIPRIKSSHIEHSVRGTMLSFRNSNLSAILSIQNPALCSFEVASNSSIQIYGNLNDSMDIRRLIRNKLGSIKLFADERNEDERVKIYRDLVQRDGDTRHFIIYFPSIKPNDIFIL